jgi:hypothetical protein
MKFLHHNGSLHPFGRYEQIVEQPSTKLWDGNGGPISRRRLERKTWLFIGAVHEDVFIGFAIVDAGLLSKAFAYVYDLKKNELIEDGITIPLGFPNDFDPNLRSEWKLKNFSIRSEGHKMLAAYEGKKFSLNIMVDLNDHGLNFICPSDANRPFHYTYKNVLLPSSAVLAYNGQIINFENLRASIDFSKGYPARKTFWNWTSFMGETEDGIPVGMNLVDGFNGNLENVIWLGDQRIYLGKIIYNYQPPLESSIWEVRSTDNLLKLEMNPKGARKENVNALVMKSKFTQVYGPMTGQIVIDGQLKKIKGSGVMEEHEALW